MNYIIKWVLTVISIILVAVVIGAFLLLDMMAESVGGWDMLVTIFVTIIVNIYIWSQK